MSLLSSVPNVVFWDDCRNSLPVPSGWAKFILVEASVAGETKTVFRSQDGFLAHANILSSLRDDRDLPEGCKFTIKGGGNMSASDKVVVIGGRSRDFGQPDYERAKSLLQEVLPDYEIKIKPGLD